MLKLNHVSVEIEKVKILEDICFSANKGEIIGLVAPNGSGKTTLLKTISNLIFHCEGEMSILGMDYHNKREDILKEVFFLQDNSMLYPNLSGSEHMKLVQQLWGSQQNYIKIVDKLNMSSYINKRVLKYSLGMQQRLLFAMSLISECDLLLMDEPMNGLDPTNIKIISEILKELKDQNKTVLFSSHILSNIDDLCDRVFFLKDGKIIYKSELNRYSIKRHVKIQVVTKEEFDYILALKGDLEIKKKELESKIIEFEVSENEISLILNQLSIKDIQFKILNISERGSQQIYEELYGGSVS